MNAPRDTLKPWAVRHARPLCATLGALYGFYMDAHGIPGAIRMGLHGSIIGAAIFGLFGLFIGWTVTPRKWREGDSPIGPTDDGPQD